MNISLIGYGKMGREIEQISAQRNVTIKQIFTTKNNVRGLGLTKQSLNGTDVCLEFTTPSACIDNIEACAEAGKNIVVGTTGWYDKLEDVKKLVKAKKIGLLYSSNFSLGMNIFYHIVSHAAHLMDKFNLYDAAVNETHHKGKTDSPSGTALAIGQILIQNMHTKKEILRETPHKQIKAEQLHVTSTRIGNVVGNHRVVFDSEADTVELVHNAKNRSGFALGALCAAEWLKGKKGVFTMKDVFTSL
jgi:4-hydroxy-tetrahydrodipicolinate reductase